MTNALPPSANIEWLRKAAKALLKTWRSEGRDARLADAQFAVAQDYGFASWRALKAHFDGGPSGDQMDAFLQAVGRGQIGTIHEALGTHPALANAVGKHPFWGGKPHALQVAIDTDREDVFDILLAAGADVNAPGAEYDNWSPLMLALSRDRQGMVRKLRAAGARTGIGVALLTKDDAALDRILAKPDWQSEPVPSGSLIALARTPHAVHALCEAGVSPAGKDRWGSDALDALSRQGPAGRPLVEALAQHGTAPSGQDLARMGQQTALETLAAEKPDTLQDPTVLTGAVDFRHHDLVEWLLAAGADPNARQDFGSRGSILHSAAWNGDAQMVRILLAHGADTDALDEEHRTTPLVWARTAREVTNNPDCDAVAEILATQVGQVNPSP